MMKIKVILATVALSFFCLKSQAYSFRILSFEDIFGRIQCDGILVRGKVTNCVTGEPLAGVTVSAGLRFSTVTGNDGTYELCIPHITARIDFSYIGFEPVKIVYNGQVVVNECLKEDSD